MSEYLKIPILWDTVPLFWNVWDKDVSPMLLNSDLEILSVDERGAYTVRVNGNQPHRFMAGGVPVYYPKNSLQGFTFTLYYMEVTA
jgi:hypothetical protein